MSDKVTIEERRHGLLANGDREFIEVAVRGVLWRAIAPMLGLLLMQLGGTLWWAATLTSDLGHLEKSNTTFDAQLSLRLNAIENSRYKAEDAARDFALRDERLLQLARDVQSLRTKTEVLEQKK